MNPQWAQAGQLIDEQNADRRQLEWVDRHCAALQAFETFPQPAGYVTLTPADLRAAIPVVDAYIQNFRAHFTQLPLPAHPPPINIPTDVLSTCIAAWGQEQVTEKNTAFFALLAAIAEQFEITEQETREREEVSGQMKDWEEVVEEEEKEKNGQPGKDEIKELNNVV